MRAHRFHRTIQAFFIPRAPPRPPASLHAAPTMGSTLLGLVKGFAALGVCLLVAGVALMRLAFFAGARPAWVSATRSLLAGGSFFIHVTAHAGEQPDRQAARARCGCSIGSRSAATRAVLDVGCGHGLPADRRGATCARPRSRDRASICGPQRDQGDNSADTPRSPTPEREGVAESVSEVRSGDMREAAVRATRASTSSCRESRHPQSSRRTRTAPSPSPGRARSFVPGGRVADRRHRACERVLARAARARLRRRAARVRADDLPADARADCAKAGVSLELRAVDRWHRGFPRIELICTDHHNRDSTCIVQKTIPPLYMAIYRAFRTWVAIRVDSQNS